MLCYDWVWVDRTDWVWIDTCCIDKSSSAELSEAINSMYNWYAKARVCYAYLSDVTKGKDDDQTSFRIRNSKWFTRVWTLQELLAPLRLVFLDRNWLDIGTKTSWKADIAASTNIAERHIDTLTLPQLKQVSVAENFSWAASRVTSRREDQAYCLFGVFAINIPLLYGEGYNAFERLQMEVIRSSNDESIFFWEPEDFSARDRYGSKVLADSPDDFSGRRGHGNQDDCSKIPGLSRPPFAITNQGLEFYVPKRLTLLGHFLLPLNCRHYHTGILRGAYAILVVKDDSQGVWVRDFRRVPSDGRSLPGINLGSYQRMTLSSVYVVSVEWVWSRETLAREESEIIYIKTS